MSATRGRRTFSRTGVTSWTVVLVLVIAIKIISAHPFWVERSYSEGMYPHFSRVQRFLFGWMPFSIGDVLYFLCGCWLFWKLVTNTVLLVRRQLTGRQVVHKSLKLLLIFAFVYSVFYLFWGINYDRPGIAYQLRLRPQAYDSTDLLSMQHLLLLKVNASKAAVDRNRERYPTTAELIQRAKNSYAQVQAKYPFLSYRDESVKSSFYGLLGDYLGFTGYYNPFTGEAQINTTVPKMLLPYIATHEMAHQLGYARENEANFVGYLAAVNSTDTLFHYSTYLDLFLYANREVYYMDSAASKAAMGALSLPVKKDLEQLRRFDFRYQNPLEPVISWMYGNYLKWNNQPKGLHTYDAVIGMLIAYYKKSGHI